LASIEVLETDITKLDVDVPANAAPDVGSEPN
jgi:hypothetical protein